MSLCRFISKFPFFLLILFLSYISHYVHTNVIEYVQFDGNSYQVPMSLSTSDRTQTRNAILVLVRKVSVNKTLAIINMTNNMIHDHHKADLIIFHGFYPYKEEISLLRNASHRHIDFVHIDSVFNRVSHVDNFEPYDHDPSWTKQDHVKWSYHHMIRFWFSDMFHMPIMKNVEYYLRIDDDSQILTRTPNIFNRMKRSKAVYMCNDIYEESYKVLPGTEKLQEFTENYLNMTGWKPLNHKRYKIAFPKNKTVLMFYNNFEVARKDFFLTDLVLNWTRSVIDSGGIYRYRWGDACLRYVTVVLFAKDNQVIHRHQQGFDYCHGRACDEPEMFALNHTQYFWE